MSYTPVSVSLSHSSLTLTADGAAQTLTATVAPSTLTDKSVKWSVTDNTGGVTLYSDSGCNTEVGTNATSTTTVYVKGLAIGNATIKVESNADSTKSATCSVTVNGTKKTTPNATFTATDYDSGTLTNVSSGMKYSINGGSNWTDITGNSVTIASGVTTTHGVKVKHPGDGITTTDSETQTIVVTRAQTPNLTVTQPTTIPGKGSVETTTDHEYSANGSTDWTDCGGPLSELAQGSTRYVRVKASGTTLASDNQAVTINTFTGTQKATPDATFTATDYDSGTLTNVLSGMKYSIDGGSNWTDITGTSVTIASGVTTTHGVKVKHPGDGITTTDSETQTIDVTRSTSPSLTATQPTTFDGTGSIPTTTAHQKSTDNSTWTDCDGTWSDLSAGTYYVRTKASGTALASDPQTIQINAAQITGTATFGQTLTAELKTGTAASWKWYRGDSADFTPSDGNAISGATSATYTLVTDDVGKYIKVTVSTANGSYTSAAVGPVERASITPTVSMADYTYGSAAPTPTVSGNTGDGTVTYTYAGTANDNSSYSANIAPTKAGSYTVTATIAATDNYYGATTAAASFTVSPKTLTPSLTGAVTKTYDGTTGTTGATTDTLAIALDGIVNSDVVSATIGSASYSSKDVGTEISVTAGSLALAGAAKDNYALSSTSVSANVGTISVRSVTLTSADDTKAYDGTALTNDTVTVTGDGFANGEGATYNVTGSQTLPGSSYNEFTYTLNNDTLTGNYSITKVEGTLTVSNRKDTEPDKKYEITVTANSGEFLYDGTEKSVSGYTVSETEFNGVTYTVSGLSAGATGTDAGEYTATVTGTAVVTATINGEEKDLTDQFIVNKANGKLTINRRSVTMTSATDTKEYDGTALTNDTVTVTGDGFANGEGATYTVTGSQKVVGSSNNDFIYTLNEDTKADNYAITKNAGTLTVTNRNAKYAITVTAKSDTVMYDGKAHSVTELESNTYSINDDVDLTYTVSGLTVLGTGTDVGTYTVNVTGTAVVTDSDGNDVSEQFSVTPIAGTLTINKRSVTLTSATDSKQYDGTPLTNHNVTVSGDGWAEGEGATYDVTGTRTLVGQADNSFTYTLNDNTKAEYYTITTAFGTLTVSDRTDKLAISPTANSGEFVYDGQEHTVSGLVTDQFTVDGATYTVSGLRAEAKRTDAGETAVEITGTAVVKDAAGNDVTDQFTVTLVPGKLTVKKAPIAPTVTIEGWYSDETAKAPVLGEDSNPGSGAVSYTYKVKGADDSTYSATVPTATGDYTVMATVAETDNYQSGTATADFTISSRASYDDPAPFIPSTPTTPSAPAEKETRFDVVDPTKGGSLNIFKASDIYRAGMFIDVVPGAWYEENVMAAVNYGLMLGHGNQLFGVGENLKGSEALALACRLHNIYYGGSGKFDQTKDAVWYQVYVDYATRYGFLPSWLDLNAPITRAQFAVLIAAALPDAALPAINHVTAIPDVPSDDPNFAAILRLYNAGILTGMDAQGNFLPAALITREQIAAVVTRVADPSLRKSVTI